ncbi:MAG: hypothetical protein KC983_12405 [Phycisphaerales bacterium]|nr:hypothetical protein [Phycisphaerales bacterium]
MMTLIATTCVLTLGGVSEATFVDNFKSVVALEALPAAEATGQIASIAEDHASFMLKTKDGSIKVRLTAETAYMLDGKPATRAEALKAGRSATVKHEDSVASLVSVTSSGS